MGRTKAIPGSSFLKGPIGALSGIGLACAVAISWPIILEVVSCSAAYADESKPNAMRPEIAKPVIAACRCPGSPVKDSIWSESSRHSSFSLAFSNCRLSISWHAFAYAWS
jgi:hypothetical protein